VIRVGFHPIGGKRWMGGRSYLWNLLYALSLVDDPRIRPVLLTRGDEGRELLVGGVERFACRGILDSSPAHVAGNFSALLGCNFVHEHWLRRAAIDVFSHGVAPLGARARVPWIYMIHDVLHADYLATFSAIGRRERHWMYRTALGHADAVVVSSASARQTLLAAYGPLAERVRVLPEASAPRVGVDELPTLDVLQRKLAVQRSYFLVANQFWKHKNHALVIDALADTRRHAPEIVVVAVGSTEDPRHPRHYDELMTRVRRLGLQHHFRHLGLVAHADVMALMRHAIAVINPSRFEGRSLTVGEAKSLGKRVLASDIDAHREQHPSRARFFQPDDAATLAALMREAWQSFDPLAEADAMAEAARLLPERIRAFGCAYQELVLDVIRARGSTAAA
jgi:glycosyltransferase involved in cell wall biosynthesis